MVSEAATPKATISAFPTQKYPRHIVLHHFMQGLYKKIAASIILAAILRSSLLTPNFSQ